MSFAASADEIDGNECLDYYRSQVVAIGSRSDSLLRDGSLGLSDACRLSFANLPTARVHGTL